MLRTTNRRRVATAFAAALTGALLLTACATGQDAATSKEHASVNGGSGDVGQISIRDTGVAGPSSVAGYEVGSSAMIVGFVVNNDPTAADQITGVTSPVASSVLIATAASAASATDTPNTSTSDAPTGGVVDVPAGSLVRLGGSTGAVIELQNLTTALIPGQSFSVTFTFKNAGKLTLAIPVQQVADSTGGQTADISPPADN